MKRAGSHSAQDTRRKADLAQIHIARKWAEDSRLIDEDGYRALVGSIMDRLRLKGAASAAHLDARGRKLLLESFRTMGWSPSLSDKTPKRGRYYGAGVPGEAGHLTQQQANYIAKMEDEMGWTGEPERLIGFIERQLGEKKPVSMLRSREASIVITGLERVTGRKLHPRSRQRRARDA